MEGRIGRPTNGSEGPFGTPRPPWIGVPLARRSRVMTSNAVQEPPSQQLETTPGDQDYWIERDLLLGRPVEDRSFEAVEATAAFAAGVAIGSAVAGPIGAVVGGVVGLSGGVIAGEALERAVGRAATTTDAAEHEPTDLT